MREKPKNTIFVARATRAVQGCTGRVGPKTFKNFLSFRPSSTGRARLHGHPCQLPGFCIGESYSSRTDRARLHGPCWPPNLKFFIFSPCSLHPSLCISFALFRTDLSRFILLTLKTIKQPTKA